MDDRERERVRAAYERRAQADVGDRYSRENPANRMMVGERERVLGEVLRGQGLAHLDGREILDVGCGDGVELERLTARGAERGRLHGIDLLEHRIAAGHARAPDLDLRVGDAVAMPWPDASFDLEQCLTLFTSVLDDAVRGRLAAEMRRVLRPGGAIIWYDFQFDNPMNRDVRKVTRGDLERLFPGARLDLRRVTLAPPLMRLLAPRVPLLAEALTATHLLSTHLLGVIRPRG